MEITTAAKKSLESGITQSATRRSSGGQICQEGFCECKDGRVLKISWDLSYPIENQIRSAKIARLSWPAAAMEAINS